MLAADTEKLKILRLRRNFLFFSRCWLWSNDLLGEHPSVDSCQMVVLPVSRTWTPFFYQYRVLSGENRVCYSTTLHGWQKLKISFRLAYTRGFPYLPNSNRILNLRNVIISKQFLYSVVNDLPPEGDSRISPDATQTTHTHKTNTPFSVANTAPGLEYLYVFFWRFRK